MKVELTKDELGIINKHPQKMYYLRKVNFFEIVFEIKYTAWLCSVWFTSRGIACAVLTRFRER